MSIIQSPRPYKIVGHSVSNATVVHIDLQGGTRITPELASDSRWFYLFDKHDIGRVITTTTQFDIISMTISERQGTVQHNGNLPEIDNDYIVEDFIMLRGTVAGTGDDFEFELGSINILSPSSFTFGMPSGTEDCTCTNGSMVFREKIDVSIYVANWQRVDAILASDGVPTDAEYDPEKDEDPLVRNIWSRRPNLVLIL